MQVQGSFDASTVQPQQGATVPPPGHYPFTISNTSIVPTKDNTGGMFVVEFTTPAGVISNRYNLWNQNSQAVEIAQKQLSALCHATGIFKLDWQNEGAALRGARGTLEVGKQKDTEYMEVKKVFDVSGNEPGKPPKQPETQMQPQGQTQNGGGWGGGQTQAPQGQPQGWGNPNPAPQPQPQPQPNAAPAGWQQQPPSNGSANPPWAGPGK